MTSSQRIASYAAEQNRAAVANARESLNLGRPPGSARGPGPDAKVTSPNAATFSALVQSVVPEGGSLEQY